MAVSRTKSRVRVEAVLRRVHSERGEVLAAVFFDPDIYGLEQDAIRRNA